MWAPHRAGRIAFQIILEDASDQRLNQKKLNAILSGQRVDESFMKKYCTVLLWCNETDYSEGSPQSKPLSMGTGATFWGILRWYGFAFRLRLAFGLGLPISVLIVGSGLRLSFFAYCLLTPQDCISIFLHLLNRSLWLVLFWSLCPDFGVGQVSALCSLYPPFTLALSSLEPRLGLHSV